MKKKCILAITALLMMFLLCGCCILHDWVEADCEHPKTCTKCEKTEGEALGHSWTEADCEHPKTCAQCGKTEGQALGHTASQADCVNPGICSVCGQAVGEALGHQMSWQLCQDSMEKMEAVCSVCGEAVQEDVNWDLLGQSYVLGTWNGKYNNVDNKLQPLTEGDFLLELSEDGTGALTMEGTATEITWTYIEAIRVNEFVLNHSLVYQVTDAAGLTYQLITTPINGSDYLFLDVGEYTLVFM